MTDIITRAGKGSQLTHDEMDDNLKRNVVAKTSNYTLTIDENREVIQCTNAITITFPDCATLLATADTGDYIVTIKNSNPATHSVTVARTGTDTFDGGTSITLAPLECAKIINNAVKNSWLILYHY